ncbi:hypothetical protein GCM10027403_22470 [Arthrobacter tecti]
MSTDSETIELGGVPPVRTDFWMIRRIVGYVFPVLVVILCGLLVYIWTNTPDEMGAFDVTLVYAILIISPAAIIAFTGLACAASTQGEPRRRLGTVSVTANSVCALVLLLPGLVCIPFSLGLLAGAMEALL